MCPIDGLALQRLTQQRVPCSLVVLHLLVFLSSFLSLSHIFLSFLLSSFCSCFLCCASSSYPSRSWASTTRVDRSSLPLSLMTPPSKPGFGGTGLENARLGGDCGKRPTTPNRRRRTFGSRMLFLTAFPISMSKCELMCVLLISQRFGLSDETNTRIPGSGASL